MYTRSPPKQATSWSIRQERFPNPDPASMADTVGMAKSARRPPEPGRKAEAGLHPRNRHASGYDFPSLLEACPGLAPFVRPAPHGRPSIDFSDPAAVKALNGALLLEAYGIRGWDLPPGYLCPAVPGRADYLHHLADLLAADGGEFRGPAIRVLDIGVGASAVYPLIGHREYGWSFVGTDLDDTALASAARILAANPEFAEHIGLRRQRDPLASFSGVVDAGESFDLTLCNPPFHGSPREAWQAAEAKWRKLGRQAAGGSRNFGGQGAELWCEGGEAGFLQRMAEDSRRFSRQVRWFTCLVSRSVNLPAAQHHLRLAGAVEILTVPMAQGQKQSRFLAWSFLAGEARQRFRSGLG
jgi:23S rRNA (adenine1618-N6)-methyltransferase